MNELVYLLIMATTSVLSLFVLSKLIGKKQIAQLEFIDYILGISIGSIAAEMATDVDDKPIYYYIIAMLIFVIIDIIFSYVSKKSPLLKTLIKGRPLAIIYDGKLNYKALKKSKLDVNDIISLCRDKNYFDISKIAYAILENNGSISIMPKIEYTPITLTDMNIIKSPSKLPCYLIIDGEISYSSLNQIGKSKTWLMAQINLSDDKQLKKIIIAIYDYENQNVMATYKND